MKNFTAVGKKIVAIGRNYAYANQYIWMLYSCSDHAKELNSAVPKVPIVFLKPTSSYLLQS